MKLPRLKERLQEFPSSVLSTVRLHYLLILLGLLTQKSFAQNQLPECTVDVPFFNLDLSGAPDMSYTTPEIVRQPGCCGDGDRYLSFYVTLHPNVAQFEIVVAPGYADPGGSGFYNIISGGDLLTPGACGTQIAGGAPVCITGAGPHKIVYSKPGNNKIKYIFRQIPKPTFPSDQSTRIGCSLPLNIYGLNNITITSINSSTGNTTPGAYNSLMSCTNCANPSFSPGLTTPAWIDYKICGTPQAAACGTFQSCDTVRLYTYSALTTSVSPNPATFCQGGSGVVLNSSASGGDGNYNYIWVNSNGDTVSSSNSYNAVAAGIFTTIIRDGLSSPTCPNYSLSVPVTVAVTPIVSAGSDQTKCATAPQALLQATSTTGTGIWSGGAGSYQPSASALVTSYTPTASEINNGSVTLTFTSTGAGGGCLNSNDQITLFFSDTVFAQPVASSILCYNGSTTINAGQTGGTAPFTYHWSTNATSNSINVTAGTYILTVTDQFGCSGTTPISISQPDPLEISISNTTTNSPACNGSATVTIFGGTPTYSISWSSGSITSTASNLCEGIEQVVVTDANGCIITQSTVINDVFCNGFNVGIAAVNDVTCFGGSDGSITAQVISGGTGPFTYQWDTSPVQNTQTATGLISGTYSVLVTDDLGCQDIASTVVFQPTVLTNTMTHVDVSIIGGSDGSATANPMGGTPPYSYLWNPSGQTTQTASNINSAVGGKVYHVNITDDQGCSIQDSVLVNQPPCTSFIVSVNTTNVTCAGQTNGAATLVVANGTPPFSISWSNGASNVMSVSNLAVGSYTVSITDSKNCSTFQNFSITQPAPLSVALVPTNIACNGGGNGSIDLTVTGGNYPYTFVWSKSNSPFAMTEDLINLGPGTYSVVVTDSKGCTIAGSIGITQPPVLAVNYIYTDNPCFGNSLGTVNATTTGGTAPYTFSWNGISSFTSTSEDLSNLSSGLYHLVVTDLNGCISPTVDVFINQPTVLSATASMTQEVSCVGGNNGTATVTPAGGTAPYTYAWTGPSSFSSSSQNITGLIAGAYQVTVTDANGCSVVANVTITTVLDVTPPVISCVANQNVFTSTSSCTYTVPNTSWNASATDNCVVSTIAYSLSGATTGTGTSLNGVVFNIGSTLVTWIATDGLGNKDTCYTTVVVSDNVNPIISQCGPATNQAVFANSGTCTYTNTGTAWNVVATDNCGIATVVYVLSGATTGTGSSLNGVVFNLGLTTITWTVTDAAGNTATCIATVTVSDNQIPSIVSCGATGIQNVLANNGVCTYTHSGTGWNATASDNCSVTSIVYNLTGATSGSGTSLNGVVFNLGTTTVTWTATDGSGNITTCSFMVQVTDNQNPIMVNCASLTNRVVAANTGLCTYTHNSNSWNATASDNCSVVSLTYTLSGATTGTGSSLNGVVFNLGVTTVTWTATDNSGNSSTCIFTVTVNDTQNPTIISCGASGNQAVNANPGACTYTQTSNAWNASATDNCSVVSVIYTLSGATTGSGTTLNGVAFNLGTTTVVWTVTDGSGNISTCTFNVVVSDNQLPTILTCGAGNQSVLASLGSCTYKNNGTGWDATASDNCTLTTLTYSLSGATTGTGTSLSGVTFNLGVTTVTWTATDNSGNNSICIVTITVTDNQLPSIVSCGASGTQNVNSNTGVCTYTNVGTGWNATASDNCSIASLTYTLTGATTGTGTSLNNVVFNLGTTVVTWTAIDGSGNSSSCSFNVIVSDNQNPIMVNCAAIGNKVVAANIGVCTYTHNANTWNATASDNCSVVSLTYALTGATTGTGTTLNGVVFNLGVTTVTWTATDGTGNTSTCIFTVTVNDTQNPSIISCGASGNQAVNSNTGLCTYTQSSNAWNASASDNCSVVSIIYTLSGATTGSGSSLNGVAFNLGTTTVVWTVTDGSGNISTCSFNVIVSDIQLPIISNCGGGNHTVFANPGICTYTNSGTAWNAIATDNCTLTTLTYALTGATTGTGTSLNGVVFNLGVTTVTWTATDNTGNISTCVSVITVVDNQVPTITSCGATGTQNVLSNAGVCTYTNVGTGWNATATDNCSITSLVYTLSGATTGSGTSLNNVVFNLGTTTVVWTATDGSGNISTCTFQVVVSDNQFPIISNCSLIGNPSVNSNLGICTYTHTSNSWNAIATDNCNVASLSYTLTGATTGTGTTLNGVSFNLGITLVTWTATDGSGNVTTCSFTVTVHDVQNPSILSCGAVGNQLMVADPGACTFTQTSNAWNASAADNCSIASIAYVLTGVTTGSGTTLNGVSFNLGTTTVTWTATDGSGNTATCSFLVIVRDSQLPVITSCGASSNQNVNTNPGVCTYTNVGNGWNATATDNCTVTSLTYVLTGATTGAGTSLNGVVFNQGLTTVTWTAIDIATNQVTCSFTVTVTDNENPVITNCPSNIVQNNDLAQCGAIVNWTIPTYSDNCSATMTASTTPGIFYPVGVTTVTYNVVDGTNNSATCSFTITVIDNELPLIDCPDTIATCDPVVSFLQPTVSDNCGVASLVQISGLPSGSTFPVGLTINKFVVTDIHGNTDTCAFTVRIHPLPISNIVSQNVTCYGFDNGTVDLQLSNGLAPYQTDWSNNASSEDLSNLAPGTYTVQVTDFHGCTTADTAVITQPTALVLNGNPSNVTCYNLQNGSIQIDVTGGTLPYNYVWIGGQTSDDLAGLDTGYYSLTVTDANGCIIGYNHTITEPDSLHIQASIISATCNANNGSIQTLVTGGTTPYAYSWTNNSTNSNLNNVGAGTYGLIVTDANGCQNSYIGLILAEVNLSATTISTDVSCHGLKDGDAVVVVNNGNGPYTYQWSNGETTQSLTSLTAGHYSCLITDVFGCTASVDVVINQPDTISVDISTSSYTLGYNISYNGGSDGSIWANVHGGTVPYNYFWSTGDTTNYVGNVPAGEYLLLVTDSNGCTFKILTHLTEPDLLEMPEGFSPNDDGDNDFFVVRGIKSFPDNSIVVFNRWGNVVYQKERYADEWYGENNQGDQLPDATYFVVLKAMVAGEQVILQGYVDLRRK